MCRPVTCDVCGKTTWAGCGEHIDAVKAQVPAAQWCDGQHTAEEIAAAKPATNAGFFGNLFNRQ